jgi:hypothetical protein
LQGKGNDVVYSHGACVENKKEKLPHPPLQGKGNDVVHCNCACAEKIREKSS